MDGPSQVSVKKWLNHTSLWRASQGRLCGGWEGCRRAQENSRAQAKSGKGLSPCQKHRRLPIKGHLTCLPPSAGRPGHYTRKSRGGHWPSRGAFSPLVGDRDIFHSNHRNKLEKTNLTFLLDQKCVCKGFSFTSCVQGICWPSSLENFLPPLHGTLLTPRGPDLRRRQVLRADGRLS